MIRPKGMHPKSFEGYIRAMFQVGIDPQHTASGGSRVVQTLGNAPASAGTHGSDGTFVNEQGASETFSVAVDISVRHDLSEAQIEKLLVALWHNGFAAWWRHTGSFAGNQHVHAVFCGLHMKEILRNQIHDFLHARSGLVGHADDQFIKDNLTEADEQHCRTLFLARNPAVG